MSAKMTEQERQEKLAKMYDGGPMVVKLKVWTGLRHQRPEEWDFVIDNLQHVRAALSDVELLDMRYLKDDPEQQPETFAIKTAGTTRVNASLPKLLHGLPAMTRKASGYSSRDLRLEAYQTKTKTKKKGD